MSADVGDNSAGPAGDNVPAVSCVMTVFNTERYLREAVDSILGQTFSDFEFIIIDDGSTDASPQILREYAAKDARIRLVSRPNTGIVRAANEGIAMARARYLARMDSDDVSLPQRFAKQVQYLDEHPDCVLLGTSFQYTDPHGVPVAHGNQKLTHDEIEAQLLTCLGGGAVLQPTVMMRTDAVRAAGCYRGVHQVGEDQDLFLRLAERGRVANLPDVLLHYRKHLKSVSRTLYRQQWEIKERMIREAYERRGRSLPAGWKFEPWTPAPLNEQLRLWGWAALKAGRKTIARRHAVDALRAAPLSGASWKLMYCALRGR